MPSSLPLIQPPKVVDNRGGDAPPKSPIMIETTPPPSPVASLVFSIISLLVISIAVLFVLRYYLPLRTTPAFLLVPVFFALWLPASMILLVPIDLASSALTDDIAARGIWLGRGTLRVSWRIVYWLTFALTWYVCVDMAIVGYL